jgi:hypothetical protein
MHAEIPLLFPDYPRERLLKPEIFFNCGGEKKTETGGLSSE